MKRDHLLNAVLVCGILATAFGASGAIRGFRRPTVRQSVQVPEWRDYAAIGWRMGPSTAHVTITEFGDFQCPFCAQTARDLESIREKFGDQVAIVFRHYPLRRHEHARRAAEIAECAAIQVPFERVYTVLYAEQDSLGTQLAPWFAAQMGVANVTAFSSCMTKHEGLVAVQRDIEAATALGVNSTPTILVNDQRITVAPRGELIESLVDSLLHAASGEVGSKDRRRSSGEDAK